MHSTTPTQRQWLILISLMSRQQGQTVRELADEVGVDDRTIRRDLNSLRKLSFPIEERQSTRGLKHWRMTEGAARVPIHFTWPEAVALHLGRRLLDPMAGTYFWQAAQTAFSKIRAMLGESALLQLDKVSKAFFQTIPGRSDYTDKADLIDQLMLAIEEHRIAFVAYQSERATEPVSLEMYPYGIVYHKGSLYLVAYSRDHEQPDSATSSSKRDDSTTRNNSTNPRSNPIEPIRPAASSAIRHFKVDRITGVDVQSFQFTPDPTFSLENHLANSFGIFRPQSQSDSPMKIRIRFSSEAARYVQEKHWHASQMLTKEKDGSVVLEVHLDDTHEIKAWALSFGPKATILEPDSLRNEIVKDIERLLGNYQTKKAKRQ